MDRAFVPWHPAPATVHDAARKVVQLCRERGVDISDVTIRFCLDHPYVSSTLVGIGSEAQVKADLKLLDVKTDPVLIDEIRSVVGPVFNSVRPSGRPENHG
jgi:L-galactose dehydrogenase